MWGLIFFLFPFLRRILIFVINCLWYVFQINWVGWFVRIRGKDGILVTHVIGIISCFTDKIFETKDNDLGVIGSDGFIIICVNIVNGISSIVIRFYVIFILENEILIIVRNSGTPFKNRLDPGENWLFFSTSKVVYSMYGVVIDSKFCLVIGV